MLSFFYMENVVLHNSFESEIEMLFLGQVCHPHPVVRSGYCWQPAAVVVVGWRGGAFVLPSCGLEAQWIGSPSAAKSATAEAI